MENQINQDQRGSFLLGLLYSVFASTILSFICVLMLSSQSSYLWFEPIVFFMWSVASGGVTLIAVLIIGIPVVMALKEFNKDSCLNAGLAGAAITFLVIMGLNGSSADWLSYLFVIYAFVCGYAFMYGVKRDEQS